MDKDMYFYNIVDCNIFIMANDMNYKKIIVDSMDCIIGNDKFTFECAGLTIEIDPLLVIFLEGHADESPPCSS